MDIKKLKKRANKKEIVNFKKGIGIERYRSLGKIWREKIFVGRHVRRKLNT